MSKKMFETMWTISKKLDNWWRRWTSCRGIMYSQRTILDQKNLYVSRESQGPTSICIGPKGILDPKDITRSLRCHSLLSTSWSAQHKVKVTHVAFSTTAPLSKAAKEKHQEEPYSPLLGKLLGPDPFDNSGKEEPVHGWQSSGGLRRNQKCTQSAKCRGRPRVGTLPLMSWPRKSLTLIPLWNWKP